MILKRERILTWRLLVWVSASLYLAVLVNVSSVNTINKASNGRRGDAKVMLQVVYGHHLRFR